EIAIGSAFSRRGRAHERPPFRDETKTTSMPGQVSEAHDSGWVYATTATRAVAPAVVGWTASPGRNAWRSEPGSTSGTRAAGVHPTPSRELETTTSSTTQSSRKRQSPHAA